MNEQAVKEETEYFAYEGLLDKGVKVYRGKEAIEELRIQANLLAGSDDAYSNNPHLWQAVVELDDDTPLKVVADLVAWLDKSPFIAVLISGPEFRRPPAPKYSQEFTMGHNLNNGALAIGIWNNLGVDNYYYAKTTTLGAAEALYAWSQEQGLDGYILRTTVD